MKREALRVTTTIPVAPTTLYFAWISSEHHTAMTGTTAKIDPNVGGKFTAQNGYISGKTVILDLGRRIVMAWRTTDFPRDAHDSRVEIHLEALGGSTRVTILHTDIPEGQAEKYKQAWVDNYFTPMRTYFSKYLPDPRKPVVRRPPPPPPEEDEEEEEETPKAKGKAGKAAPISKVQGKKVAPPAKPAPAKPVAKPSTKAVAKPVAKPAPKPVAKPAPKPAAKPAKAAAKPAKPAAKKPAAKPAKPAPKKPAPKAAKAKPKKKK